MLLYNVLRKSNKGFTLIEIITTVIIIGVLASIAAPNFLGLLNRNRVRQALEQVEGAVKESQRLAIRKGKTCKIRFTSTGTGSDKRSVVQVRPNETIGVTNISYSGCLLNTRELPSEISFGLLDPGGSGNVSTVDSSNLIDLAFSSKGIPNVEGTMVISHPNVSIKKCIEIKGLLGNILTGNFDEAADKCEVS